MKNKARNTRETGGGDVTEHHFWLSGAGYLPTTPQIPMLKPNPQCDGIGKWSI